MMKYGYETTDGATYQLLLEKAKEMRNNPTEAEKVLWQFLVGGQMGEHFRRQHPIAGYIPDFVCLKKKLIIEIDGGYHLEGEQPEKDEERTALLESEGFEVIRFTNEEVLFDIDAVLETISDYLDSHPSIQTPTNSPSPREGYRVGSICDALLGAANMRDIGYHWPDTSDATLNMDSKIILKKTMELIATKGYRFGNLDATVCAERPKINPHVPAMKKCLAEIIGTDEDNISIKATTTEKLGFTGREEGMSAFATVLIEKD